MRTKVWYFIPIMFLMMVTGAAAQKLQIQNVHFVDQVDTISIRYDLIGKAKQKHFVSISVSYDYGKTFSFFPQAVRGDVGRSVRTGVGKEIIWQVKKDFPDGLVGDGFVFAVESEIQKWDKRPLYALGAGLLGGIVYLATKKLVIEPESTTGKIQIIVPSDF
jgi:hypothetical protein